MILAAFRAEFARYRALAEHAARPLTFEQLREPLDPETNSIAVIMKHVSGNLRSRWTEPFSTDGEKPWRNRDDEFVDNFTDREGLEADWSAGWAVLDAQLALVTDADLARRMTVRGEPHTLAAALARSLAHTAYHCGQIVQLARHAAHEHGVAWKTLTIPRGGSAAFNRERGYCATPTPEGGDGSGKAASGEGR